MVRIICWAAAAWFCVPQAASALSTDFEDLVLNTTYNVGSTINSGDLSFDVVDFPGGSQISVDNLTNAGGTGLELNLGRSIALDFQLPATVQEVTFLFGDYAGASTGIVVNGVASTKGPGFGPINSTTIAGVNVDVVSTPVTGGVVGRLTLTGPIQSLIVGGTEFHIDDILIRVPEPVTILLLGLVAPIVGSGRRPRPALA